MTYNELKKLVNQIKVNRGSIVNREKLRSKGLGPAIWEFRGSNHKKYTVMVNAGRDWIGITSRHRLSTLDKWCSNSVGHVVETI